MLNKDGHEALNRTKNGSVNNHGACKSGLEGLLDPFKLFLVKVILWVVLASEGGLFGLLLIVRA